MVNAVGPKGLNITIHQLLSHVTNRYGLYVIIPKMNDQFSYKEYENEYIFMLNNSTNPLIINR